MSMDKSIISGRISVISTISKPPFIPDVEQLVGVGEDRNSACRVLYAPLMDMIANLKTREFSHEDMSFVYRLEAELVAALLKNTTKKTGDYRELWFQAIHSLIEAINRSPTSIEYHYFLLKMMTDEDVLDDDHLKNFTPNFALSFGGLRIENTSCLVYPDKHLLGLAEEIGRHETERVINYAKKYHDLAREEITRYLYQFVNANPQWDKTNIGFIQFLRRRFYLSNCCLQLLALFEVGFVHTRLIQATQEMANGDQELANFISIRQEYYQIVHNLFADVRNHSVLLFRHSCLTYLMNIHENKDWGFLLNLVEKGLAVQALDAPANMFISCLLKSNLIAYYPENMEALKSEFLDIKKHCEVQIRSMQALDMQAIEDRKQSSSGTSSSSSSERKRRGKRSS